MLSSTNSGKNVLQRHPTHNNRELRHNLKGGEKCALYFNNNGACLVSVIIVRYLSVQVEVTKEFMIVPTEQGQKI